MELIIKNKVIYDNGKTVCCGKADRIARANKHPHSNTPMAWAEQFTEYYNNKSVILDENLQIVSVNDLSDN